MTRIWKGALLFDIDGTLADTDPLHLRAFNAMLGRHGRSVTADEYAMRVMGRANADIMRDFFPDMPVEDHRRLADAKEAAFRELAQSALHPTAGLISLIDWAEGAGIPVAAVTNAPRPNADMVLASLDLAHRIRTVIIGDTLARSKPDPLPYIVAGERLGVDCRDCVAFEDSRSGVRSASAAGAATIGVMSSLPEAELVKAGAQFAVRDFGDARLRPLIERRLAG